MVRGLSLFGVYRGLLLRRNLQPAWLSARKARNVKALHFLGNSWKDKSGMLCKLAWEVRPLLSLDLGTKHFFHCIESGVLFDSTS